MLKATLIDPETLPEKLNLNLTVYNSSSIQFNLTLFKLFVASRPSVKLQIYILDSTAILFIFK